MYIPKKNRFEMFLKRKSSTSSNKGNRKIDTEGGININSNWSDICTGFIKDVVLRRRSSLQDSTDNDSSNNMDLLNDPNLCLDQLSEFQKSYISFPEFSDSSISNESDNDCTTNSVTNSHYWVLSSSSSTSTSSSST
ncbi:hypothetical protein MUCCIDRAFT_104354 [Mucor lusitanicus CBS 277.49]|uniref:Uncharacterized protein n=1 Tax=Mucor lusitanicus CBS 277.49 TaxID=747725 RepID=A0A168PA98_MUCCL|nr:hypothetical protein MUCCIDRAFT_104354 [Mucor lusitanicus CBS 277.49]